MKQSTDKNQKIAKILLPAGIVFLIVMTAWIIVDAVDADKEIKKRCAELGGLIAEVHKPDGREFMCVQVIPLTK